jgi:hypothetical protein
MDKIVFQRHCEVPDSLLEAMDFEWVDGHKSIVHTKRWEYHGVPMWEMKTPLNIVQFFIEFGKNEAVKKMQEALSNLDNVVIEDDDNNSNQY